MPIAVLILVLAAYVYVLVAVPEWRRGGLLIGALAAAGLGVYFWLSEPEGQRAAARIAPSELVLSEVELTPTPRGRTLRGRVENTSPLFRLREMTVTLTLRDCPADAGPEAGPDTHCPVIAQSSALVRVDVPPGQLRAFSAPFVFPAMPAVLGELRWEHAIAGTRATD
jgi:hypothetical protein